MKSLHVYAFLLGLFILQPFTGMSQSIAEQRVERYLFSSYDANKAGMMENDRIIAYLEKRLEDYSISQDKESLAVMKEQEKEFNKYLGKIDEIKDPRILQNMVELTRAKDKVMTASIMENGIRSLKEADECRKIILTRIIELELMKTKNEKLLALLKDNSYRGKFISTVISSGEVHEETDTKSLMILVDKNLSDFRI